MVRPVRPKPAASLVITKQKKNDLYVLMGQRPKNSRFAPNVWVFLVVELKNQIFLIKA